MEQPTFDEWYSERHGGRSFDQDWMQPHQLIHESMKQLSRELRDYVSEMEARKGSE